ncbi:MAG: TonB-dependent receptor [Bacteroidetes bacterium]|nr:TonB-dependent receptor [Bacteroidota bacterium]
MRTLTTFILSLSCVTYIFSQQTDTIQKQDSIRKLKEVVVFSQAMLGSKFAAKNRTGSAYFIDQTEIKKFGYTDINRVLRNVPGVNLYEEDGFGLRPNISLRGTSAERSAKITVMEDGVLIAPAPYSAPAAYYFPNVGRMNSTEILKGSSQIQYGPYTTGGAINLISSPITKEFSGYLDASAGNFHTNKVHARVSGTEGQFGYMAEFLNQNSDGFKDIDNSDDHTGFDKNDYVAKLSYSSRADAKIYQNLLFKIQYSDETSNETYLGLTEEDFESNPFRRYVGSQEDVMETEHQQYALTHYIEPLKNFNITTSAYINVFERNWFKLDYVLEEGKKIGIANLLDNPNDFPELMAIVKGEQDSDDDVLAVKANNRRYKARGIQTNFNYFWNDWATHQFEVGARYHYDEEDRFQWVDAFKVEDGRMQLTQAGTPGTDANRVSAATAFSAFIQYKLTYDKLTITPGIRYENISLEREDYGKNDTSRTGENLSRRVNNIDQWIPGIGVSYKFNESFSAFGGVHRGFSPPTNTPGQDPEKSINYELGTRFSWKGLTGEVVGFFNDYSNLLGSDLAASGGTGSLDQFNAGEVEVKGIELLLNYNLLHYAKSKYSIPLGFSFTYNDAEFKSSFDSAEDIFGVVNDGDEVPYITPSQFNASIGLEHEKFNISLSAKYSDTFRTFAGSGTIPANQRVSGHTIVDFASAYHLNKNISLRANIINLLDEEFVVARRPAGLRPGHPFGMSLGIVARF